MGPEAILVPAQREERVAAQVLSLVHLPSQPGPFRGLLGRVKDRQRPPRVEDAQGVRRAEQRGAPLGLRGREVERTPKGLERTLEAAEVSLGGAGAQQEGVTIRPSLAGELQPALRKPECFFEPVARRLGRGRVQKGPWRLRVSRLAEVLGVQDQVAAGVPSGGAAGELAPPALEQGAVDRVADQGVTEQERLTLRADEEMRHETIGGV